MHITTLGVDLAKNTFTLHGVDENPETRVSEDFSLISATLCDPGFAAGFAGFEI
jgi:hypothetical protein